MNTEQRPNHPYPFDPLYKGKSVLAMTHEEILEAMFDYENVELTWENETGRTREAWLKEGWARSVLFQLMLNARSDHLQPQALLEDILAKRAELEPNDLGALVTARIVLVSFLAVSLVSALCLTNLERIETTALHVTKILCYRKLIECGPIITPSLAFRGWCKPSPVSFEKPLRGRQLSDDLLFFAKSIVNNSLSQMPYFYSALAHTLEQAVMDELAELKQHAPTLSNSQVFEALAPSWFADENRLFSATTNINWSSRANILKSLAIATRDSSPTRK